MRLGDIRWGLRLALLAHVVVESLELLRGDLPEVGEAAHIH